MAELHNATIVACVLRADEHVAIVPLRSKFGLEQQPPQSVLSTRRLNKDNSCPLQNIGATSSMFKRVAATHMAPHGDFFQPGGPRFGLSIPHVLGVGLLVPV